MALLIPVGNTWMTADQLNKVVTETIPQLPPGKTGAAVATLDNSGATIALEMEKQGLGGDWMVTAAYQHDWNGDNAIGGKVMYSW